MSGEIDHERHLTAAELAAIRRPYVRRPAEGAGRQNGFVESIANIVATVLKPLPLAERFGRAPVLYHKRRPTIKYREKR
jgi:hypothetical protein